MSEVKLIADQSQRDQALDPSASYIVQAPAGSGKTGLLVQRVVRLLSVVDSPEEIVAITFTRKAAGEMRDRIIRAFNLALQDLPPEKDYERVTWELAREALARDRELGWGLLNNPGRLRIQTIDSFCSSLARQMPLLSRFGAAPAVSEDSADLYREAARNAIAEMESGESWSSAIEFMVRHLDNRLEVLQQLIATMLARRDQWLRHVADPTHPRIERNSLEDAFSRLIEERLTGTSACFSVDIQFEILAILPYCIDQLKASGSESMILSCADISDFPSACVSQLEQWKGLATLLLTANGEKWRSRIDKNTGFPPESAFTDQQEKALAKQMKARMKSVLDALSENEEARKSLASIMVLPSPKYSEEEWQTLNALFEILRISAASLELVFQQKGQVDFTAMSQAATRALGEPDNPTDLALALDYKIQHILVDEFQDTSWNQYELVKRLTVGWQENDGRSLFLVGDPMQSIYRFREAEVGLFLEAWKSGIGSVRLNPLKLSVNFRSQGEVVNWINGTFQHVLPLKDNIANGAVRYAPSVAYHDNGLEKATHIHPFFGNNYIEEAQCIISIIRSESASNPDGTIAILVRGRKHLVEIVRLLKQEKIRFRAIEIESLAHRPVIKDLLTLTRALLNPADRVAWLAGLRAPWCGVSLMDLEKLASVNHENTVLQHLEDDSRLELLSNDGRERIQYFSQCMKKFISFRDRSSIRSWVENCWYSLGGPACVASETDLADAEEYFSLLDILDGKYSYLDVETLSAETEKLFASPDILSDERLQVMTVHKSKGLEFDTVILPGLGRKTGNEDNKLMNWIERPLDPEGSDLLLAPIKQTGEKKNEKYSLLSALEKEKSAYEDGRLLYVATTRARKHLHLLGQIKVRQKEDEMSMVLPSEGSLLFQLWPLVYTDYQHAFDEWKSGRHIMTGTDAVEIPEFRISRLKSDWRLPHPPTCLKVATNTVAMEAQEDLIEFSWAGETARHIGTVVHRYLQKLGETGPPERFEEIRENVTEFARQALMRLGVNHVEFSNAVEKVEQSLEAMLGDERGRWILNQGHKGIQNEYPLSFFDGKEVRHYIMDRTFVDEKNTRWIIDYKTGVHLGGNLDAYLDQEVERYRHQLNNYAKVFAKLDENPIRLALYFPLMRAWREWGYHG